MVLGASNLVRTICLASSQKNHAHCRLVTSGVLSITIAFAHVAGRHEHEDRQ